MLKNKDLYWKRIRELKRVPETLHDFGKEAYPPPVAVEQSGVFRTPAELLSVAVRQAY